MKHTLGMIALFVVCFMSRAVAQPDTDHDGLTDTVEQQLLEQYRPTFMISRADCAGLPARIKPGQIEPEIQVADGTIYGQVFPSRTTKGAVEIHYYTLWTRDCGRLSHPFDVEHVAALVNTNGSDSKALFWYAGAHEDTVCDISSAARAETIDGKNRGPKVWSSSGKHALYLRQEMCQSGCGADSCVGGLELARKGPVINLGEPKVPASDLLWVDSPGWRLSQKMDADFTADMIATLESSPADSVITVKGRSAVRGTIQGSNKVLDRATSGANGTGAALGTANNDTSSGLAKATRATGRSLKRAWKAVFGQQH